VLTLATPYSKCYEVFLRHLNDMDFLYPKDGELDTDFQVRITNTMFEIFQGAVVHFFDSTTILKRDDINQTFENDLRPVEIEIIGLYMVRDYYRKQLNFLASLKDSFSDKDWKSHDKANQMNQYRQMLKEIEDEIEGLINANSYADDYGQYEDWLNKS
jgi:hypothetical protein